MDTYISESVMQESTISYLRYCIPEKYINNNHKWFVKTFILINASLSSKCFVKKKDIFNNKICYRGNKNTIFYVYIKKGKWICSIQKKDFSTLNQSKIIQLPSFKLPFNS